MEGSACVEVFSRDESTFYLVVEPVFAKDAITRHLELQPDEVAILKEQDTTVGDVGLRLKNGKPLEEVLGATIHITNRF